MKESITNYNSIKLRILIVLAFITIAAMIFVPTFGRFKNRTTQNSTLQWDGSIATSYSSGSGTSNSPYIISNGSEFAYFLEQLKTTNYSGKYFQLSKDIVLNRGTFEYDGTINYTLNEMVFQIDEYGKQITEGFNLNTIEQANEFAGTLNGNHFRIHGLYMTSETNENLSLFKNLTGTINNLYISNVMIYGKTNASAIAINTNNAKFKNVMIDGNVVGLNGTASTFSLNSTSTTYNQFVNKAYVYGKTNAAGIALTSNNDTVQNGYNTGYIQSTGYASGLFDKITNNQFTITRFYNDGITESPTSSQFINTVEQSGNFTSCFATQDEYLINTIGGWGVSTGNSFAVYSKYSRTQTAQFQTKTLAEITVRDNLRYTMGYTEFDETSSVSDSSNPWLVRDGQLPLLYIDDLSHNYTELRIGDYMWSHYTQDVNTLKFRDAVTFTLGMGDMLSSNDMIQYFIQNSSTTLSHSSLTNTIWDQYNWKDYTGPVTISNPGTYIIYTRIRIRNSGWWTSYTDYVANSDVIVIANEDLASVQAGDFTYKELQTNPRRIYLDEPKDMTLTLNKNYTDELSVMYYQTSEKYTKEQLDELSTVWTFYTGDAKIENKNSLITYYKIYDYHGIAHYISTDSLSVNGYNTNSIIVGRNLSDEDNVSISDKSTININFSFDDSGLELSNYTKNIVTNTLLPEKTKITILDNINNKVYTHITDSSDYGYTNNNKLATYPLNKFKEISTTTLYKDNPITGVINDDYTVKFDFSNTNITSNIENINVYLRIMDSNSDVIVPTLKKSIKTFSIIKDSASSISLSSNYQGSIDYNRDNSNSIDFKINIDKKDGVVDSTYQDQVYGLQIKMVNEDTKEIMDRTYLSNLMFKYKDKSYPAFKDGVVNVNLGTDTEGNLILDTYMLKDKIEGNYAFYICPYASYDGINNSDIPLDSCKSIPINIVDNFKEQYVFDVVLESDDRILTKNEDKTLNFEIIYQGELKNPNIRISLYEKNEYTAYDQTYSIVDLKDYVYGDYTHIENKLYYLDESIETTQDFVNYSISFNNTSLNLNGYKLIFDLYSEDRRIGSIEKRFIVKGDK